MTSEWVDDTDEEMTMEWVDDDSPVCIVRFIDHNQGDWGDEYSSGSFSALMDQNAELLIQPPEGYYVSDLILTNESGETGSAKDLLSAAKAHTDGTEVSLWFKDIKEKTDDGMSIKSDYLSANGSGSSYILTVVCDELEDDAYSSVSVDSGDVWYDGFYGGDGSGVWTFYAPSAPSEPVVQDGAYWELDSFVLRYDNGGPNVKLAPGQSTVIYRDATLTAKWNDVSEQYAAVEEPWIEPDNGGNDTWVDNNIASTDNYAADTPVTTYTEPIIPEVRIQAASASKYYDGTPLTSSGYSVESGSLGEYTLGLTYNEITEPGSVSAVSDYALYNADGWQVFNKQQLDEDNNFVIDVGTLTVYDSIPTLIIEAESYSKEYDGTPLTVPESSSGYSVTEGNLGLYYTLRVGFGSITEIGTASTLQDYALVNPYGQVVFDKTQLDQAENFKVINGTLTVTKPSSVIPSVNVQGVNDSKVYDGTALTKSGAEGYTYTGDFGDLEFYVTYNSITDVGSVDTIATYELRDHDGNAVFDQADLDASTDFTLSRGTLSITAPAPTVPVVIVQGVSDSKEYDGTPLTKSGTEGYTYTGDFGDYNLVVTYNTITEVGSVNTIATYHLEDQNGTVVFDQAALDDSPNFTIALGTLTVREKSAPPAPVVPTVVVQGVNDSKVYDGTPLTKSGTDGYTVTGNLGEYQLAVTYNSITEIGSVDTIKTYELQNQNGETVFTQAELKESANFTLTPGTLTVTEKPAPPAPTVPVVILQGVSASKEYDGKPLTKSGSNGYELTGTIGDLKLVVTYNSITDVGSVDTISSYELQDQSGKVVFDKAALDASPNFTFKNGKLTVTKPSPAIPKATLQGVSESKEYNGSALTKDGNSGYSVSGSLGDYDLRVSYNSITEPGSVDTLSTYALYNKDGSVAFSKEELDASPNFTVKNGKLTVTKRALRIIAISGTLNTKGETITASALSSQDGSFRNGYRVIGLLDGHQISGSFVQGSSNQSFKTTINKDAVQITDKNSSKNVTGCYEIETQDGYITIIAPTTYDLIINPKSYTWTYDGTAHTLREYEQSGLMNGDRLTKVNFSADSTITDVGSQSNRITSVEVVSATGGDVDQNKYILISTPGTLTVEPRDLTVTAISGSLTTDGKEIVASSLSTPDGTFKSGYKAEGLVNGHSLTGSFVTGRGTGTFTTGIDLNQLRVVDANGNDVTRNYSIRTVAGAITINAANAAAQRSNVTLSITAKSGTFTYDGNEHKLEEYNSSGLVDGDVISKVTFKPSSVITDVGTQANEIQSVVILSSTGAAVDNSKYNINYYSGTLTVTKFPLTLTAVSDEKVYDGKALNNKNVKSTALANSNHKLSADYEIFDSNGNSIKNGPVDAGVYTKKVSNVKILSGATDVTANYDITAIDGTLKITDATGASSRATSTTAYYGNTFTIRSDAPYTEFQYLMIDGQKVPAENYTVKEGSTIITLKSSYIQNLKSGAHNYTIVSTSKQVDGSFTLTKAPKTADGTSTALWIILLLAAALLVALGFFLLKRSGKLSGGSKQASSKKTGGTASSGWKKSNQQELRYNSGKAYVKKPVSEVISDLDFDPEPVEDDDPTSNLMKGFDLNLDDFRKADPPAYTTPAVNVQSVSQKEEAPIEFKPKEPDFGSFRDPVSTAAAEPELPDLEVEVFEGDPEPAPEVITAAAEETIPEPAEEISPEPVPDYEAKEESLPVEDAEPRRRGRHEAPDPFSPAKPPMSENAPDPDDTDSVLEEVNKLLQSDPFSDSWYESLGIERKDRSGK